jgi:hypothetical protein
MERGNYNKGRQAIRTLRNKDRERSKELMTMKK